MSNNISEQRQLHLDKPKKQAKAIAKLILL